MVDPTGPADAWVPDFDTFAARLAGIRHRMGWNVKEAAAECELPHTSWRDWEINDRAPRNQVDVCRRISRRTGVDLAWLLLGEVQVQVQVQATSESAGVRANG